ncbi:MAG: Lrp/AsnC family transcriptional regulator [Alphaproteobacteria bacterium]|jgi:DNA-binding Lrp family transcriptional regulator
MARAPADQFLKQAPHVSESDRAIIRLLQEDGRRPFVQIARETGLAEKTVRNRVRNLLDDDIIQIAAVTNPQALGYLASALLGITTDPAVPASDIALSLLKIESVDYVVVATGRYGIFAELICRDREALQAAIENEIGRVPGITGIESYPYLQIHYQLARFHAAQSKATDELGVRPRALTDTDRAIIQALSIDGRTPLQTIADDLSISESQVRNRVGDMVDAGVMNVMAIVNPMSVEYGTVAWVAIKVGEGHRVSDVASTLADLSRITYVAICAGRFDIFAEVMCTSEEELLAVMDGDIRMIAGVHRAEASIYQHLHYKRLTPIRD